MNELEKLLLKYPQINVKQIPWLDIYFKNNPNVTDMAIGGPDWKNIKTKYLKRRLNNIF